MGEQPSPQLPAWQVAQWLNTERPLRLADLRGRVVLIHAFQMLCPGCIAHGLPLASKVHEMFAREHVAVVGLHCVFEHHDAMQPHALRAFVHEYRLRFPIGIDLASPDGPIPRTMASWELQGTPSTLVLDRDGGLRLHRFGAVDELWLGALLGELQAQGSAGRPPAAAAATDPDLDAADCADGSCEAPR